MDPHFVITLTLFNICIYIIIYRYYRLLNLPTEYVIIDSQNYIVFYTFTLKIVFGEFNLQIRYIHWVPLRIYIMSE